MRSKILLMTHKIEIKVSFAEILSSYVNEGLELFFTEKESEAEKIIKEEMPQLIFWDSEKPKPKITSGEIISIVARSQSEEEGSKELHKPIKASQLLAYCQKVLTSSPSTHVPLM